MGNDYDTGHGLPSEFPSDPSYTLYVLVGGLLTVLLIALVAAAIIGFLAGHGSRRRINFDDWPSQIARFVKRKSDAVIRSKAGPEREPAPIEGFWAAMFGRPKVVEEPVRRNVRDIDVARAEQLTVLVRRLIGSNLALGKEVSSELKALTEALEGFKEIRDGAPAGLAAANGGTVININVNSGVPGEAAPILAGPYAQAGAVAQAVPQIFENRALDRDANIWLAFNKFRDDWSNPEVMAAQLKASQIALCTRPPEPPRPA